MAGRKATGEGRESSGGRERSYLFLSLILLVWNILATGNFLVREGSSVYLTAPGGAAMPVRPASLSLSSETVSPREGPLSAKQKYLIGKQIDINKASKKDFDSLPGVSDAMAAAIVAERERVGAFRSPDDLMRVKGIKEKRLRKILPFLKKMENN